MKEQSPIFIIGCMRSGTTLLCCILNKHPDLLILLEDPHIFTHHYKKWSYQNKKNVGNPNQNFVEMFYRVFGHFHTRFNISKQDIFEVTKSKSPDWGEMLNSYMNLLMSSIKPSANCWGEKTPHNVANMVQIQEFYPNAKFIYIQRDPRDIVSSLSKTMFPFTTNNSLFNAEVFNQYLLAYQNQKQGISSDRLLEIKYESLIENPQETVKKICNFLNIDYTDNILKPADQNTRNLLTLSWYKGWDQIKPQKINHASSSKLVESYLEHSIREEGYEIQFTYLNKLYKFSAFVYLIPFKLTRSILNLLHKLKYPNFTYIMLKFPKLIK